MFLFCKKGCKKIHNPNMIPLAKYKTKSYFCCVFLFFAFPLIQRKYDFIVYFANKNMFW